MESVTLVGGMKLQVHDKGTCLGEYCTIHRNSDHHMVKWKQVYDFLEARMVRICSHKVPHPDPDELPSASREHECDGCCIPFHSDVVELTTTYEGKNDV